MRIFRKDRSIASEAPPRETGPRARTQSRSRATPDRNAQARDGVSLFQDQFFVCNIMSLGDLPAPGCVYLEIVADRDAGLVFAKLYPSASVTNAVDILATRVIPFFDERGRTITRIVTPRKSQYCGAIGNHAYATFLAASRIELSALDRHRNPYYYFCEQLYWLLLHQFFQPALRHAFFTSIEQLQKELDRFLEAYNAARVKNTAPAAAPGKSPNFAVHP